MDWKKIEEVTGHKIIYASIIGSRNYNLENENSDIDYCIMVSPSEKETNYLPNKAYKFSEAGYGDCFFKKLPDENNKLLTLTGMYTIQSYKNIVYVNNENLLQFINENKSQLFNISPRHTYITTKELINFHINNLKKYEQNCQFSIPSFHEARQIIQICGAIYNFMNYGDFEKSLFLEGKFLELYQRARNLDPTLSITEIENLTTFLFDDITYMFFNEFAVDNETLNKFYDALLEFDK